MAGGSKGYKEKGCGNVAMRGMGTEAADGRVWSEEKVRSGGERGEDGERMGTRRSGWGRGGSGFGAAEVRECGNGGAELSDGGTSTGARREAQEEGQEAAPTEHRKVGVARGGDGCRCSEARTERVGPGCESGGDPNRPRLHEMSEDKQREWASQR